MSFKRAALFTAGLVLLSWLSVRAGIYIGHNRGVPLGEGQDLHSGVREDLYRFDAEYYYSIATDGYSYDGDPNSSPNIVFAPLYPLAIDVFTYTGLDHVQAGFVLNKIFLSFSVLFLLLFLRGLIGEKEALWTLAALLTAAGSYSFHAYYSESTMLVLLSFCLLTAQRKMWLQLAGGSALLGAARVTALPIVLLFSAYFLHKAWDSRADKKTAGKFLIYALVSPAGLVAYLTYIAIHFGNPFQLFPQIQSASWGFFHPPTDWLGLLSGWNLIQYWSSAFSKGLATFSDPKTLNLVWTTLGLAGAIYAFKKYRRELFAWVFIAYFAFVYLTNSSSDFLISAHRFFVLMLPIFLMFSSLHAWIARKSNLWVARAVTGLLLLLNLSYGLFHTAYFNNGVWYYF